MEVSWHSLTIDNFISRLLEEVRGKIHLEHKGSFLLLHYVLLNSHVQNLDTNKATYVVSCL